MYRLLVESLLGLRLEGNKLHLSPCLPADWPGFKIHYRYQATVYRITVTASVDAGYSVTVDGMEQTDCVIPLLNDLTDHLVTIVVSRQILPD